MEMLLSKTPAADVKSDVLPMIYRALESDTAQIQELCLSIIPGFAGKLIRTIFRSKLIMYFCYFAKKEKVCKSQNVTFAKTCMIRFVIRMYVLLTYVCFCTLAKKVPLLQGK